MSGAQQQSEQQNNDTSRFDRSICSFAQLYVCVGFAAYGLYEFVDHVLNAENPIPDVNIGQFVIQWLVLLLSFITYGAIHCQDIKNRPNVCIRAWSSCGNNIQITQRHSTSSNKKCYKIEEAMYKALIIRRFFFVFVYELISILFRNAMFYYSSWVYSILEIVMLWYDLAVTSDTDLCGVCYNLFDYVCDNRDTITWTNDEGPIRQNNEELIPFSNVQS